MYFIRFKNGKISEYRQYTEPHHIAHQLGMPMPDDPPVTRS
jgi:ketosteroid isomerase-like protein